MSAPDVVNVVADSTAFMLADLKRSGLTPDDFPVRPVPQTAVNGVARYRIHYPSETGYWKDRHDREDAKYTCAKGHSPILFWCQDPELFQTANVNASVEGAKKALTFHIATGIPTAGLDSCWGWGEPLAAEFAGESDEAVDDGPQRVLRHELRQGFGPRKIHLVLMDGDWSSNLKVARALATYVWEAEQWGSQILCIDLGHDAAGNRLGFDDWMVDRYGSDRDNWPTQDEMRKVILTLPRIDVSELPLPSSWFLETDDRFNRGHMDFSDRGNATLWLRILGPNNVKYLADIKEWLVWDKEAKRWARAPSNPLELVNCAARRRQLMADKLFQQSRDMPDKDDPKAVRLMAEAKRWQESANRLSSVPGRKAVLEDASARKGVVCRSTDFDPDPNLLAVQNGVVDLRTGLLRDEVQEDMIRHRCAAAYSTDEPQGKWAMKAKTFIQQVTAAAHGQPDPDAERYLRRRIGAALRGLNALGSLEIAYGSGANGKGVLADMLQRTMGTYAVSLPAATVLSSYARRDPESASPFLMMAVGKRIVILSETKDTDVLDEAKVKILTGVNDVLTIRGNYKDGAEYPITFTVFLLTNSLPNVAQGDAALWDRLAPFHFRCRWRREAVVAVDDADAALPPADLAVRDQMPKEPEAQSWLLWWAVRGGIEWSSDGLGSVPQHLKVAAETYKESQNKLGRWLEDSGLELDPDASLPPRDVYQTYVSFCAAENIPPYKADNFFKKVYAQFPQLAPGKSMGARVVKGIRRKAGKKYDVQQ